MNLYHWRYSELLKNYATGSIIVMAQTIEEARIKAFAHFESWVKQYREDLFFGAQSDTEDYAQDCKEELDIMRNTLRLDLERLPVVVSEGVIFILGSE